AGRARAGRAEQTRLALLGAGQVAVATLRGHAAGVRERTRPARIHLAAGAATVAALRLTRHVAGRGPDRDHGLGGAIVGAQAPAHRGRAGRRDLLDADGRLAARGVGLVQLRL